MIDEGDAGNLENGERFIWNEPGRYGAFKAPMNPHRQFARRSVLYVMGDGGPLLKVGIAAYLKARLTTFQLSNPRIVCLAYRTMPAALDRQVEMQVHRALSEHAAGREWFGAPLPVILAAAKPILGRAERVYIRMVQDGVFGDIEKAWASRRPA